ncbi:LytR/AlgR family response regulator transcription factor [Spirosoma validum]|uniref:Response regulator transcription factor n=1 Tax=Spirosoma validum TaxID=2771355 RepID=A0A927B1L1_9BACT|nr:LytTR family DNA-binding domain-containing protein [Spirosoma validum]MBD2753587.1 response regulator transcription factor [Spirosoma validum]
MIRAIALDDEPLALRVITRFCEQIDFIDLQKTFFRTDQALTYLEQFPVDLLFLDINMPSMSGIDFYKTVAQQALTENQMVIFTTAHAEHAVEGFNLNAVDYLLKPFTFERFLQAANRAADYYRFLHTPAQTKPTYIYIRADYRLYKIDLADILYIEGLDDYLKIHIQTNKPIVTRMTMKAILQKLAETDDKGEGFIRVHRSFIVPVSRIDAIRNKSVLVASQEIPIGASYEDEFFKRFAT